MKLVIIKLLIFLFFCYGTARFCHHQTSGFKVSKITSNCFQNINYEEETPSSQILSILGEKFTYFGRGLQSFAFLSEDGTYVLKIFNNKMQKKYAFLKIFSHKKAEYLKKKIQRTFESYKIAYEELKKETALLYIHPVETSHLKKQAILIDKLGIAHQIDLDKTGFVLQKKATLVYPWLKKLIEVHQLEEAKKAIHSLLELLLLKCKKGIADQDPLLRTNFGFLHNSPIQIDVGPFSKEERIKKKNVYFPELLRITASLEDWLQQHSPELAAYLQKELENVEKNF